MDDRDEDLRARLEKVAAEAAPRTNLWTAEEEELLRDFYPRLTVREIAAVFGRSIPSVARKVQRMGILKGGK